MSSAESGDGTGERKTFWSQEPTAPLSTETFWPDEAKAEQPDAATAGPAAAADVDQPMAAEPVRAIEAAPAWQSLERPNRRAPEDRGILRRVVPAVLVGLGWLAVVAYGVVRFDLLWSLGALAAGVVAVALGLRGRTVIGLVPVLAGAAAWGMATGGQAPAALTDLPGDASLIGWNALYAVPLLVTYALATRVEQSERAA